MGGMSRPDIRQLPPEPEPAHDYEPDLAAQLVLVSRGDHRAFELVYGELAGPVYGVVRQVLRDPPLPADRPRRERRVHPVRALRFPRRIAVLAAAASVAAAVALGITQLSAQHQLDHARDTAIARVVTAPDARVEAARTSAGGNVTVVTSAALREAVVSTSGMASLPSSRVYQVWVMSPSGARSAGLMHGSSLLASSVRPGDRIGITVEPAGGTTQPTTAPVAVLPV